MYLGVKFTCYLRLSLPICALPFISCCTFTKVDIPRSWITEEVNIEVIHQQSFSFCQSLSKKQVAIEDKLYSIKINCKKGEGNPFKHSLKPGYRVFRFDSPKEYWEGLSGRRGFVLEIDGKLVETIMTSIN